MSLEKLLDKELESSINCLEDIPLGTEEYKASVDAITKLLDKSIELKKLEIETDDKIKTREFEESIKTQQMEDEKKDRIIKNWLTGASIVIPAGCGIWGFINSIKFEETGTITTLSGRSILGSILKFKK